jgi:hypothetical protein
MVMTSDDHAALTPAGRPVAVPIPVAPVVEWVISVNAVFIHNVGVEDAAVTVLSAGLAMTLCTPASSEAGTKVLFPKSIEYTSPNVAVCKVQLDCAKTEEETTNMKDIRSNLLTKFFFIRNDSY